MVRDWPRDTFPRNPYIAERYGVETVDDNHYGETQDLQRRQPPMVGYQIMYIGRCTDSSS